MAGYYDTNKDYSVEIEKAKASGASQSTINQLITERQNKIDAVYGGVEPTLYGSNQTYSQASSSGDTSTVNNAMNMYSQYSGGSGTTGTTATVVDPYAGTDFHQDAINAAQNGDWDGVISALNKREEKVAAQGGNNYGKSSAEIYAELMQLYGKKDNTIPEYSSQNSSQINYLLSQILNREDFRYDYTTDPTYLAYADQYKRLGDRAREDTLGNVAAMNGGYASSWAASAASQAQNDYNQQLSDVIPTLYDAAYNRYMDDYNMDVTNYGILKDLDDTYYNRYRDKVGDYQWQSEFDYMKDRDAVSDSQWQQTFDWNQTVDKWNMSNTEATQKFDRLMTKWQLTGVADEEVAAELGVPVGATTESYYFNKLNAELSKTKATQGSTKESSNVKSDAEVKKEVLNEARGIVMKTNNYKEAARSILNNADVYGYGMDDYFSLCKELGVSDSAANEVLNEELDEYYANGGGQFGGYAYWSKKMGEQGDIDAQASWLASNWHTIGDDDIVNELWKAIESARNNE